MRIGSKAQGQDQAAKEASHTHTFSRATARRCERAIESRVRQAGQRQCREG